MTDSTRARELLASALELHVLEPEDLLVAGHPAQAPEAVLEALVGASVLSRSVERSLERLALGASYAVVASTETTAPLDPPAEVAATTAKTRKRPRPVEAGRGTFAPEQDGLRSREIESSHVALAEPRHATFAPEQAQGLVVSGGTVAESRETTDTPIRSTTVPEAERASGRGELVNLRMLDPIDQRTIQGAAFCRIALGLGLVTRERLLSLRGVDAAEMPDRLVADGAVLLPKAAEISVLAQTLRVVCRGCLVLAPRAVAEGVPCASCGQPWQSPIRSATPPAGTVTPGNAAHGIVGFPGAGGSFAGYELLERVAEGGMGVVFRARQNALNRIVALKVMRGGSLASKTRKRRFLLEAEAAAGLKHPGIVPVHEIDEVAGYPFYTMDFVEGPSIDKYVASHRLGPRETARLVRVVADAVHYFHLHGIVHRDLKPDNILVGSDGAPKIIDFGIAKKLGEESKSATVEGDILGTLHYMSPEQASGRTREVDTRTDVYALGAILYELLAGAPPWDHLNGASLILAIQNADPDSIRRKAPGVEADLEAIVFKAMAKERERRYQGALALANDLDNFDRCLPIQARPATFVYRARKAIERRLPLFVAGAVALLYTIAMVTSALVRVAERHRKVATLLAEASEPARPSGEREKLLAEALFIDPESAVARGRLDVLVTTRKGEDALARERERLKQASLESELARERAEREVNAANDRERARLDAERQALADAERRARSLFEEATHEKTELTAVRILGDALALLGPGDSELRSRIEDLRVELELHQSRSALAANQTGLAAYWLADAQALGRAGAREAELTALSEGIQSFARGQGDLDDARGLRRAGDLIGARTKFEQALRLGVANAVIEPELAIVRSRCLERARTLVADGRSSLDRGDPIAALSKANQALAYTADLGEASALTIDAEERIASDARRRAAALFGTPQGRQQALAALDQALRLIKAPRLVTSLARERSARAALVADASLSDLVYVPDVPELGVGAIYMQRTEVTNAGFREFIDEGGYRLLAIWDEVARPLLGTFRDGCAGGECEHQAPRSWTDGGYGDEANASRPVRGVNYYEARAYARWLSRKTGAAWRLPTEREWEAAAGWDPGASALRVYAWGDAFDRSALPARTSVPLPSGASTKDVSALGMLDASGSVRQWVVRRGSEPGTKGSDFGADEPSARYWAAVKTTGVPGPTPSVGVTNGIGFRLVREIEVDR